MYPAFKKLMAGLAVAVMPAFTSVAAADSTQCGPFENLEYDLQREGQSLQSQGNVSSDITGHRIELYGNTDTGKWTLVEFKGEAEEPCFYKVGGIFFNEGPQDGDGELTRRQSALARHSGGDGSNEAFEIFVHEGTGRWFMTRRISEHESTVVFAGSDYQEQNSSPYMPYLNTNAPE